MSINLEEIEARLKAARPKEEWAQDRTRLYTTTGEDGYEAAVWYDDGDICAQVHDNLGLGCRATAYAELFAHAAEDIPALIAEVRRLRVLKEGEYEI